MVGVAAVVDVFENSGDKVETVIREHSEQRIVTLLEVAAGGEAVGDVCGLSLGLLVLAQHLVN